MADHQKQRLHQSIFGKYVRCDVASSVGNASAVFAEIEKVWGRKWFGLMKGILRDLEDPRPFPVSIFFRARPSCYFLLSFIMSYF
jgi:hypothetical protein